MKRVFSILIIFIIAFMCCPIVVQADNPFSLTTKEVLTNPFTEETLTNPFTEEEITNPFSGDKQISSDSNKDELTQITNFTPGTRYTTQKTTIYYLKDGKLAKEGGELKKDASVSVKAKYKDGSSTMWAEVDKNSVKEFLKNSALTGYKYFIKADSLTATVPNNDSTGLAATEDDISDGSVSTEYYKPDSLKLSDSQKFVSKAQEILGIIRNIGVAVGVIAISIIGLRYMFASVEEKAEYKQTMMPFMIGAILLIAGTTLVNYIYQIAINL